MRAIEITTEAQLQQAFALRKDVFVQEQGVPEEAELDAFDTLHEGTTHVLVYDGEVPTGTGRFRLKNGVGKVERVCVAKAARGKGIGNIIMEKIEQLARLQGYTKLKLHGQTHAESFYHRLGYETTSAEFLEENIPHVEMTKELL